MHRNTFPDNADQFEPIAINGPVLFSTSHQARGHRVGLPNRRRTVTFFPKAMLISYSSLSGLILSIASPYSSGYISFRGHKTYTCLHTLQLQITLNHGVTIVVVINCPLQVDDAKACLADPECTYVCPMNLRMMARMMVVMTMMITGGRGFGGRVVTSHLLTWSHV